MRLSARSDSLLSGVLAMLATFALAAPAWPAGPPLCDPAQLFAAGPTYTTDVQPRTTLARDLNGDGILDEIVCVYGNGAAAGNITVFLGNGTAGVGDGTFSFASSTPTDLATEALVTGDFNEDGITDIAASNLGSHSVSILIGHGAGGVGDGTFAPAVSYPVPASPYGIASADFDQDGIADLVVADNGANRLLILGGLGSGGVGNGTFAVTDSLSLNDLPLTVVTGDFDENGAPDIACTINYRGKVGVFLGAGGGAFLARADYVAGSEPYDLLVDDLDADGIDDLIVGNGSVGGVAVLRGQGSGGVGNGTFGAPLIVGAGTMNTGSVIAGDFDGDGIRDVIGAHTVGGVVYFLRGEGDGHLQAPVAVASGNWPFGLSAGDFNGDGMLDLGIPNFTAPASQRLAIWYGQCLAPPPPPPGPEPILDAVRDVPNDQGGKVFVQWQRSPLDGDTGNAVTGYRVWRRIPPLEGAARLRQAGATRIRTRAVPAAPGGTLITYWEALAELPAQQLEGYGYTAATTQDSLHDSNPYTAFFVTALTADPTVFYDSAVDSGYSVDNLPPFMPQGFSGTVVSGEGVELSWEPVGAADLLEYRVYRGATGSFVPDEATMLAAVAEPGYLDPDAEGQFYYKVAAVDEHENVGPYAMLTPSTSVDVGAGGPLEFALHGVLPNPNRGGPMRVSFTLAQAGPVVLRLVDLSGREVAVRRAAFDPGRFALDLAPAGKLHPGIYFLFLAQGSKSARMKVTVLR